MQIEEATPDTKIAIRLGDFDKMRNDLAAAKQRIEELQPDAALGALVLEMPGQAELRRDENGSWHYSCPMTRLGKRYKGHGPDHRAELITMLHEALGEQDA